MEEITPREFDPDRINPDPDAESIAALTFLLELPHCPWIDDLVFLVSDRGGSWPGWSPDAIGHMAGMPARAQGFSSGQHHSLGGVSVCRERREALRDQIALVAADEAMSGIAGGGCVGGVVDGDRVALGELGRPR